MYADDAVRRRAGTRRRRKRRGRRLAVLLALCAACILAAWHWSGASADAPADLRLYAAAHGTALREYPAQLIALYRRNPETRDYVFEYPQAHSERPEIDLRAEAGGGTVPLLMQWDQRWGYDAYAGDLFGLTGCGPTCLSMVALYRTGDASLTPAYMRQFATEHGYAAWNNGTEWALFSEGAAELGLSSQELPLDRQRIVDHLETGGPVVCVVGPGDFTATGHFLVLTGWEDGKFRINDPNSRENSERLWAYEEIQDQIRNLWAF